MNDPLTGKKKQTLQEKRPIKQRHGEPQEVYRALVHYYNQGDRRSVTATADYVGKSRGSVSRWKRVYCWGARIEGKPTPDPKPKIVLKDIEEKANIKDGRVPSEFMEMAKTTSKALYNTLKSIMYRDKITQKYHFTIVPTSVDELVKLTKAFTDLRASMIKEMEANESKEHGDYEQLKEIEAAFEGLSQDEQIRLLRGESSGIGATGVGEKGAEKTIPFRDTGEE